MTKLEENNLNTQIELMKDIISNYGSLLYRINATGDKVRELLSNKVLSDDQKTCTLDKKVFDQILDTSYALSDTNNFGKFGTHEQKLVSDNESKIKILRLLQKS